MARKKKRSTKSPPKRAPAKSARLAAKPAQAALAMEAALASKATQESRARDIDEILVNENIRRRALINRTLRERIAAHRTLIAATRMRTLAAQNRPLNILAQGDSWFDYPVSNADIIDQLPGMLDPHPLILNLAHHGEVTTTLLGVRQRERFVSELKNPDNGEFDAILFSGGGNDIIGDQLRLWLREASDVQHNPSNATNGAAFEAILSVVLTGYRDLVVARNLKNPAIPIFVNAYDFARATNEDVCGVIGPWLYPSLNSRGWMSKPEEPDLTVGSGIVKAMLVAFQQRLMAELAADNVVVVQTQGVLGPDQWANETHPTREGFRWITRCFAKAVANRFSNRVQTIGF